MSALVTASYRDRTVALLTQHGKENVIGAVLEAALGCRMSLEVDGCAHANPMRRDNIRFAAKNLPISRRCS